MTIHGVSLIVAAMFVSVIDDAGRFRNAHQVEAYLGLVPNEDSSGGKRKLGAITKAGNSYLRALLVQAGWSILRNPDPNEPMRRWGGAIAQRRGKRVAVVAVARRLAGVMWAMARDGTVYDPASLGKAQAAGLDEQARRTAHAAQAMRTAARKLSDYGGPTVSLAPGAAHGRGAQRALEVASIQNEHTQPRSRIPSSGCRAQENVRFELDGSTAS